MSFTRSAPYNLGQGRPITCTFCKGWHAVDDCDKYANAEDRRTFVETRRMCSRCLSDRHRSAQCQSKAHCKYCAGNDHNSALCKAKFPNVTSERPDRLAMKTNRGRVINLRNILNGNANAELSPAMLSTSQGKENCLPSGATSIPQNVSSGTQRPTVQRTESSLSTAPKRVAAASPDHVPRKIKTEATSPDAAIAVDTGGTSSAESEKSTTPVGATAISTERDDAGSLQLCCAELQRRVEEKENENAQLRKSVYQLRSFIKDKGMNEALLDFMLTPHH